MMFGGLMWVFWIALLVGVFFLARSLAQQSRQGEQKAELNSLEILKKRYARGKIGRDEFEQKKRDLLH